MQSDKAQRVGGVSGAVAIHIAIRTNCSNFYGSIAKPTESPIDSVALKRGDNGIWLCVVKRLNTDTGDRQVVFGHGGDFVEALVNANALISAGRWVKDKPWSGR